MKKLRLVEWVDSGSPYSGWGRHVPTKPIRCTSVGRLVHKNRKCVTLASSSNDEGQVGGVITIPRSAIKRIRKLRIRVSMVRILP